MSSPSSQARSSRTRSTAAENDAAPPRPDIPEKLFFKIGEVSRITGVKAHVLRYWESEFPSLSPPKNRSSQRVYRRKDIETVFLIKELLYDQNFTISGARKRMKELRRTGSRRGQLDLFPNQDGRKQVAAALRELEEALALLEAGGSRRP